MHGSLDKKCRKSNAFMQSWKKVFVVVENKVMSYFSSKNSHKCSIQLKNDFIKLSVTSPTTF